MKNSQALTNVEFIRKNLKSNFNLQATITYSQMNPPPLLFPRITDFFPFHTHTLLSLRSRLVPCHNVSPLEELITAALLFRVSARASIVASWLEIPLSRLVNTRIRVPGIDKSRWWESLLETLSNGGTPVTGASPLVLVPGVGKKRGVEEEEGEKNLSNREQNRETVEKHGDDGISSVPDHELMGSRSLNSY